MRKGKKRKCFAKKIICTADTYVMCVLSLPREKNEIKIHCSVAVYIIYVSFSNTLFILNAAKNILEKNIMR